MQVSAAKVVNPQPRMASMCTLPAFTAESRADLAGYIVDSVTMLTEVNNKNKRVNAYNAGLYAK